MKKINTDGQLTVKEFLQLEDGYYNLENPIEYAIEGSKHEPEQLFQETYSISHQDDPNGGRIHVDNGQNTSGFSPQDGVTYHVKLEFASGFTSEGDIEAENMPDLDGTIFSLGDVLDDLQPDGDGCAYISMNGNKKKVKIDIRTLANAVTNQTKYGDTLKITVTEQDDGKVKPDGELSGVITVHTDVKVLSGLMKIVTTCADDVSYYVDNVWQDGEILEVSAKDEESGSGGGGDVMVVHIVSPDPYTTKIDKETSDVLNAIGNKPIIFVNSNYDAIGYPKWTSDSTFTISAYQVTDKYLTYLKLSVDSDGIVTTTVLGTVTLT